jgi:hypothetical protein
VPQLGKCGRSERDLRERRQALIDEPLKPVKGSALVTGGVRLREEFAELKRVGKGEDAHLARSHLGILDVSP